jgi:hypothetical protein
MHSNWIDSPWPGEGEGGGKERGEEGSGKREGGRWENEKGEREGDGVSKKREGHREAEVAYMYISFFLLRISDFFEQNGGPKTSSPSLPETGISMDRLQHIGKVFSTEPEDFNTHNSEN